MTSPNAGTRFCEHTLLSRRVEGDRLLLSDAVLAGALEGSRALSAGERAMLEQSPLTLRRFRRLALELRAATAWTGSAGMLRAASGRQPIDSLSTDDGCWTLHFVGKQVILSLAADAPFAARLMRDQPLLRVRDGAGAVILQGRLDVDGECEDAWPFKAEPARHFQLHGGRFGVEPVQA